MSWCPDWLMIKDSNQNKWMSTALPSFLLFSVCLLAKGSPPHLITGISRSLFCFLLRAASTLIPKWDKNLWIWCRLAYWQACMEEVLKLTPVWILISHFANVAQLCNVAMGKVWNLKIKMPYAKHQKPRFLSELPERWHLILRFAIY